MIKNINKIIYFDKETIRNILQEQYKGSKVTQKEISTSMESKAELDINAQVKLAIPFLARLSFLFSGKINASYMIKRNSETTLTSTEISEFEELKTSLTKIKNTQISYIENSSTFFRVAGGYLRIMKGGIEGVDIKEFNAVMDGYDGYDTYKVDDRRYVRFNNTAFVSNYKRNDLLSSLMTLYCIEVGEFDKEKFDFIKQINDMEKLYNGVRQNKSLSDVFPSEQGELEELQTGYKVDKAASSKVLLYDVVYACVTIGE